MDVWTEGEYGADDDDASEYSQSDVRDEGMMVLNTLYLDSRQTNRTEPHN